tara:strand:+ start:1781 stop:2086 length:306 start_codon:yes stop_codon:yes gene_type:complete
MKINKYNKTNFFIVFMKSNILDLFEEILNDSQKHKCVNLFTKINNNQLNSLITIWENSSSLLRWNNIVKELKKNQITEPDNLNILMLGLQHYVDKKTYNFH